MAILTGAFPTAILSSEGGQDHRTTQTTAVQTAEAAPLASAAGDDLAAIIEEQIRAFADSIDKSNADDTAATALAKHGITGGGKKLSVGKSHALTATLMNSELAQKALTVFCERAIRSMQQLDLDQLEYVRGNIQWSGTTDSFYLLYVFLLRISRSRREE